MTNPLFVIGYFALASIIGLIIVIIFQIFQLMILDARKYLDYKWGDKKRPIRIDGGDEG